MAPPCICCSLLGHLSTQFGSKISLGALCLTSAKKWLCFKPQIWISQWEKRYLWRYWNSEGQSFCTSASAQQFRVQVLASAVCVMDSLTKMLKTEVKWTYRSWRNTAAHQPAWMSGHVIAKWLSYRMTSYATFLFRIFISFIASSMKSHRVPSTVTKQIPISSVFGIMLTV